MSWMNAQTWAWRGVSIFAIAFAGAALFLALVAAPEAGVDPTPFSSDAPLLPASGVQGFNTEAFCKDRLTDVRRLLAPDSSGVTYQLVRVRDGVTETVKVQTDPAGVVLVGTHYIDSVLGPRDEPAHVNAAALECIEGKAR